MFFDIVNDYERSLTELSAPISTMSRYPSLLSLTTASAGVGFVQHSDEFHEFIDEIYGPYILLANLKSTFQMNQHFGMNTIIKIGNQMPRNSTLPLVSSDPQKRTLQGKV
jgi:hypothetical protein